KKPVESVPPSGRLNSEVTVVTTGNERRTSRVRGQSFHVSFKKMVYGTGGRPHTEPSSRCGMNSAPMPRIITRASTSSSIEDAVTPHARGCRRSSDRTYHDLNLS